MLRMSFLEHLEELRSRILRALAGVGVAFVISLTFCDELWQLVSAPAVEALRSLGFKDAKLTHAITPMEAFNIVWVKLPDPDGDLHCLAVDSVPGVGLHRARTIQEGAAVVRPVCHLFRGSVHCRRRCSAISWRFATG